MGSPGCDVGSSSLEPAPGSPHNRLHSSSGSRTCPRLFYQLSPLQLESCSLPSVMVAVCVDMLRKVVSLCHCKFFLWGNGTRETQTWHVWTRSWNNFFSYLVFGANVNTAEVKCHCLCVCVCVFWLLEAYMNCPFDLRFISSWFDQWYFCVSSRLIWNTGKGLTQYVMKPEQQTFIKHKTSAHPQ